MDSGLQSHIILLRTSHSRCAQPSGFLRGKRQKCVYILHLLRWSSQQPTYQRPSPRKTNQRFIAG
jgi:hypothetical protein